MNTWPQEQEQPPLRIVKRKHMRGPIATIMIQRDGQWPEFITDPVFKDSHHHVLDPQEKERRRKARAAARALTPKQVEERKAANRAKSSAYYHANKEKLLPKMRARAKDAYARMTPEQKAAKRPHTKAYKRAHPEKVREYNQRYNAKRRRMTYTNTNNNITPTTT